MKDGGLPNGKTLRDTSTCDAGSWIRNGTSEKPVEFSKAYGADDLARQ